MRTTQKNSAKRHGWYNCKRSRLSHHPVELQQYMRAQTGTSFHTTYVRKIMHSYNLSPKVAQKIHINRASRKAVWNWRYHLKRRISCLEKEGFVVIMQDEAFFVHDTVSGRKYWSPKGKRISVEATRRSRYTGRLPWTAGSSSGRTTSSMPSLS